MKVFLYRAISALFWVSSFGSCTLSNFAEDLSISDIYSEKNYFAFTWGLKNQNLPFLSQGVPPLPSEWTVENGCKWRSPLNRVRGRTCRGY